jgi:ABC-type lipoprotein release transport system permease subunit
VFIEQLNEKQFIEDSHLIIDVVKHIPFVVSLSARYIASGKIEAGYKTQVRHDEKPNSASGSVAGINPYDENKTTEISNLLIAGRFLDPKGKDEVVLGSNLLNAYNSASFTGQTKLYNADVGSRIRLTVSGITKEVTIVGVVKAKVNAVDNRIFMLDREVRSLTGRSDFNVNEIAIKAINPSYDAIIKSILEGNGFGKNGTIRTSYEAQPQFLRDVTKTFDILGNVIGSIGLVVASITIFIVIFVNAITRRKYIGILKGIGVNSTAIEFSYIVQSLIYATGGTILGLITVYGFLLPYFQGHPINFPFSDGVLVADVPTVVNRIIILYIATIFAGYIPARIVVKQRTLDAILGR